MQNDPFLDTALHIGATSPAVDNGIILPNFNSLDFGVAYSGSARNMGAFESGPPCSPLLHRPPSTVTANHA